MIATLNPHIVNALPSGMTADTSELRTSPSVAAKLQAIAKSHEAAATAILSAIPELTAVFPKGLPLAYALYPKLKRMPVDDLAANKFGGIPDLRRTFWLQQSQRSHRQSQESGTLERYRERIILKRWPRCPCCNTPMKFVAQLDLSDWTLALHTLTARPDPDYGVPQSGLGIAEQYYVHRTWWYIYMCTNSHFNTPDSDALLQIEREPVQLEEFEGFGSSRSSQKPALCDEEYRSLMQRVLASTICDTTTVGTEVLSECSHRLSDPEDRMTIEPQQVTGFELRWHLETEQVMPGSDFSLSWELEEKLEEVQEAHQELFLSAEPYQLFGKPRSQQQERRPWAQTGYSTFGPGRRMSPLLAFNFDNADVTAQIYADMLSGRNRFSCKTDMSCT